MASRNVLGRCCYFISLDGDKVDAHLQVVFYKNASLKKIAQVASAPLIEDFRISVFCLGSCCVNLPASAISPTSSFWDWPPGASEGAS